MISFLENNDQSDDAIENLNGDDQKKPDHPVQSIIKKASSEKHARFSVANVTREPGGQVESSNVKYDEEVFGSRFLCFFRITNEIYFSYYDIIIFTLFIYSYLFHHELFHSHQLLHLQV